MARQLLGKGVKSRHCYKPAPMPTQVITVQTKTALSLIPVHSYPAWGKESRPSGLVYAPLPPRGAGVGQGPHRGSPEEAAVAAWAAYGLRF